MKSAHLAHHAKNASHAVSVKSAFANCASLWTLPRQWLQLLPLSRPKKNVRPVRRAKSASLAHHVKNVHRAKPRLQHRLLKTKKSRPTKSRRRMTTRTTTRVIAHVVAPVVSVVAATAVNVNAMPTAT